jgi:GNAT superfamily N-acetyltransferase
MNLSLEELTGADIESVIADLAGLRMTVFREFPYLYAGSISYEMKYLQTYLECEKSLIVVARDGSRIVGASSALPLAAETSEVQQPFLEQGFDPKTVFYLAESVLLPAYRGHGLGKRFFEARENRAKKLGGFSWAAFCAVQRAQDHPLRPTHHRDLDSFWQAQGYEKRVDLKTFFSWQEIGEETESQKPMTFWLKNMLADNDTCAFNSK